MPEKTRRVLLLDAPRLAALASVAAPFKAETHGWDDLRRAAEKAPPSAVVVLDPFVDGGPEVDPRALALVEACRAVPVLAMAPFRAPYLEGVRALLRHGLTDLTDAELEHTADAIRLRLFAVHAQPLKRRLEAELSRFTSAHARTLLRAAAEVVTDGGGAVSLGKVFGSNERTVAGWCERQALPTPGRLLAWLRVLLALLLLERPGGSVVGAARDAGYASDHSLRRALRELLGDDRPPRERSFGRVMETFNAELRDYRERARAARRGERAAEAA